MNKNLIRKDLIYPELSYTIVGCTYEVWNELGPGHSELTYQKATAVAFGLKNLQFTEQLPSPVYFREKLLNNRFFDFLVEEKIIVELKKYDRFSIGHIDQVHDYLVRSGIKLAILVNFTKEGVKTKRLLNSVL